MGLRLACKQKHDKKIWRTRRCILAKRRPGGNVLSITCSQLDSGRGHLRLTLSCTSTEASTRQQRITDEQSNKRLGLLQTSLSIPHANMHRLARRILETQTTAIFVIKSIKLENKIHGKKKKKQHCILYSRSVSKETTRIFLKREKM